MSRKFPFKKTPKNIVKYSINSRKAVQYFRFENNCIPYKLFLNRM